MTNCKRSQGNGTNNEEIGGAESQEWGWSRIADACAVDECVQASAREHDGAE
jgi:hypothetical protein